MLSIKDLKQIRIWGIYYNDSIKDDDYYIDEIKEGNLILERIQSEINKQTWAGK